MVQELIVCFLNASWDGDASLVNEMLDVGVPFDIDVGFRSTALKCAAIMNRTDVTQLLLDKGADVDKRSGFDHSAALHMAVRYDNTDITEVLLKHGASTNIKDHDGNTPIDYAPAYNNEAEVRLLEQH